MLKKRKRSSDGTQRRSKRIMIAYNYPAPPHLVSQVLELPDLLKIIATSCDIRGYGSFHFTMRMLTMVSKSLHQTCKKIFENEHYEKEDITSLKGYAASRGYFSCFKYLHECDSRVHETSTANAAYGGHMDILRYCSEEGFPFTNYTLARAATGGDLEVLNFIEHKVPRISLEGMKHGVASGDVKVIKWFEKHIKEISEDVVIQAITFGAYDVTVHLCENYYRMMTLDLSLYAARSSFDCLKYLVEHGCPYNKNTLKFSLKNNNDACFHYLIKRNLDIDDETFIEASKYGKIEAIKEMRKLRDWSGATREMMHNAVQIGNLPLVKYLHEEGIKIPPSCCTLAAENGILEMLVYTLENNSSVIEEKDVEDMFKAAIGSNYYVKNYVPKSLECTKYIYERFKPRLSPEHCAIAAEARDIETLKYLRSIGCPWDEETSRRAAKSGSIDCLEYVFEHKAKLCTLMYEFAIESGNPRAFVLIYKRGYPLESRITERVALQGWTTVLRMLHRAGVQLDERCCEAAAMQGNFGCMKYSHLAGVPWKKSCTYAAENGHLDCLKYAHKNGAAWDERCTLAAAKGGHSDCFYYAAEHSCPYDRRKVSKAAAKAYIENIDDEEKRYQCYVILRYIETSYIC